MSDFDSRSTDFLELKTEPDQGESTQNGSYHDSDDGQTKKRTRKDYIKFQEFDSLEHAKEAISNNKIQGTNWGKNVFRETKSEGRKQFYKCSICSNTLYINYHKDDFKVSIFVENKAHDHGEKASSFRISQQTKDKVYEMCQDGKTPKQIITFLREHPGE